MNLMAIWYYYFYNFKIFWFSDKTITLSFWSITWWSVCSNAWQSNNTDQLALFSCIPSWAINTYFYIFNIPEVRVKRPLRPGRVQGIYCICYQWTNIETRIVHSSKKIETVLVEINETKLQTQIVLSESEQTMIVN